MSPSGQDLDMTVASKPQSKFSFRQALNYTSARKPLNEMEKVVVSIFLLFFLIVVGAWLLDEEYITFKEPIVNYTKPIMGSLGWVQYWGLFSPQVREMNYHSTAVIEFADGTSKIYEFPNTNINQKDYFSHFGGEKKRKLFGDCMPWPGYSQFLPDIARFIARANDDKSNPPRVVTVLWHKANTPTPDPKHWIYRDNLPHHTTQTVTFIYKVTPQDLPSSNTSEQGK